MCPQCQSSKVVKKGVFERHQGRRDKVQRYACRACGKGFSEQTFRLSYRSKKSYMDQPLFRLLNCGVSQRRCARVLGLHQITIARKIKRLGRFANNNLQNINQTSAQVEVAVFDEMETFEHTKMKPLSIAVAVEEGSRRILAVEVASMPAKGLLAARSRKKYGPRRDDRPKALLSTLETIKRYASETIVLKSDQSPRYPGYVARVFPGRTHKTYEGRRGCVVGQGELTAGGFDPLFSLNHTCAMVRDNIKRLSRRTWCTTKKPEMLQSLMTMYACYHNQTLDKKIRLPRIDDGGGAIM